MTNQIDAKEWFANQSNVYTANFVLNFLKENIVVHSKNYKIEK